MISTMTPKITLIFSASFAFVKWWYICLSLLFSFSNWCRIYFDADSLPLLPSWYSGKHREIGEYANFSSKTSFLFRNKSIGVLTNHRQLQICWNTLMDSIIRFEDKSSARVWSYSDIATTKATALTSSKQCNHFLRSERCPPTSTSVIQRSSLLNDVSTSPIKRIKYSCLES